MEEVNLPPPPPPSFAPTPPAPSKRAAASTASASAHHDSKEPEFSVEVPVMLAWIRYSRNRLSLFQVISQAPPLNLTPEQEQRLVYYEDGADETDPRNKKYRPIVPNFLLLPTYAVQWHTPAVVYLGMVGSTNTLEDICLYTDASEDLPDDTMTDYARQVFFPTVNTVAYGHLLAATKDMYKRNSDNHRRSSKNAEKQRMDTPLRFHETASNGTSVLAPDALVNIDANQIDSDSVDGKRVKNERLTGILYGTWIHRLYEYLRISKKGLEGLRTVTNKKMYPNTTKDYPGWHLLSINDVNFSAEQLIVNLMEHVRLWATPHHESISGLISVLMRDYRLSLRQLTSNAPPVGAARACDLLQDIIRPVWVKAETTKDNDDVYCLLAQLCAPGTIMPYKPYLDNMPQSELAGENNLLRKLYIKLSVHFPRSILTILANRYGSHFLETMLLTVQTMPGLLAMPDVRDAILFTQFWQLRPVERLMMGMVSREELQRWLIKPCPPVAEDPEGNSLIPEQMRLFTLNGVINDLSPTELRAMQRINEDMLLFGHTSTTVVPIETENQRRQQILLETADKLVARELLVYDPVHPHAQNIASFHALQAEAFLAYLLCQATHAQIVGDNQAHKHLDLDPKSVFFWRDTCSLYLLEYKILDEDFPRIYNFLIKDQTTGPLLPNTIFICPSMRWAEHVSMLHPGLHCIVSEFELEQANLPAEQVMSVALLGAELYGNERLLRLLHYLAQHYPELRSLVLVGSTLVTGNPRYIGSGRPFHSLIYHLNKYKPHCPNLVYRNMARTRIDDYTVSDITNGNSNGTGTGTGMESPAAVVSSCESITKRALYLMHLVMATQEGSRNNPLPGNPALTPDMAIKIASYCCVYSLDRQVRGVKIKMKSAAAMGNDHPFAMAYAGNVRHQEVAERLLQPALKELSYSIDLFGSDGFIKPGMRLLLKDTGELVEVIKVGELSAEPLMETPYHFIERKVVSAHSSTSVIFVAPKLLPRKCDKSLFHQSCCFYQSPPFGDNEELAGLAALLPSHHHIGCGWIMSVADMAMLPPSENYVLVLEEGAFWSDVATYASRSLAPQILSMHELFENVLRLNYRGSTPSHNLHFCMTMCLEEERVLSEACDAVKKTLTPTPAPEASVEAAAADSVPDAAAIDISPNVDNFPQLLNALRFDQDKVRQLFGDMLYADGYRSSLFTAKPDYVPVSFLSAGAPGSTQDNSGEASSSSSSSGSSSKSKGKRGAAARTLTEAEKKKAEEDAALDQLVSANSRRRRRRAGDEGGAGHDSDSGMDEDDRRAAGQCENLGDMDTDSDEDGDDEYVGEELDDEEAEFFVGDEDSAIEYAEGADPLELLDSKIMETDQSDASDNDDDELSDDYKPKRKRQRRDKHRRHSSHKKHHHRKGSSSKKKKHRKKYYSSSSSSSSESGSESDSDSEDDSSSSSSSESESDSSSSSSESSESESESESDSGSDSKNKKRHRRSHHHRKHSRHRRGSGSNSSSSKKKKNNVLSTAENV